MLKLRINNQPSMNYNQQSQLNPKGAFKASQIIHLALLAGQSLFAGIALFLKKQTTLNTSKDTQFLVIAVILSITGFFVGNLMYKRIIATTTKKETLTDKMPVYQSALITRYALLEGASLFSIVSYFITANFIFLIIAGVIIAYFITLRPTIDTVAEELSLTYEEKLELEN
jgi:hypothetical protein